MSCLLLLWMTNTRKSMRSYWMLIVALILPYPVYSFIKPSETMLYIADNFAQASGYLQIPRGGSPLTSTQKRPTCEELGINRLNNNIFFQLGIKSVWDPFGIYIDYQHNHPVGSTTLTSDLLTHGVIFPAGTPLSTHATFDLYQVGLNRRFKICNNFALYPEAEIAFFSFSYREVSIVQSTDRAFGLVTQRIGLRGEYAFNCYLMLSVDVAASIPFLSDLQLRTARTDLNFNIYTSQCTRTTLFMGVGYEYIDFKDGQVFPNHVHIEYQPIGYIGLKFHFI